MAERRPETMSPVDLPDDMPKDDDALGWTSLVIMTASLFLLLTNATALNGWAVELAPSPMTVRIVAATERWEELTERFGLAAPRAALHARWTELQAARFGTER